MTIPQASILGVSRIGVFTCLLLGIVSTTCRAASSIFDEDWVPPKREIPARAADPTPAVRQADPASKTSRTPDKPAEPTQPRDAAVGKTKIERHAIPAASDLARSRSQFKELFAKQLADRTVPGRRALAKALLDEVPHTADNPVDQYALLGGAINAAKEGGNVRLCFHAVDLMAKFYDVDALAAKTNAALTMPLRADTPANASENVREVLDLLDPLIASEDYTSAVKVCGQLKPLMANDSTLAPVLQKRSKELETLRLQQNRLKPVLEKLKTAPEDPAANLFAGSYYCFTRGMWAEGLPMLAKGSDAELKKLALADLAEAAKDENASQLGDAWWKLGEKQSETLRVKTLQHAALFYKRILASSTGLRRVLLEKRIRDAQIPDEASRVDLLALFSRGGNAVNGTVKFQNGILTSGSAKNLLIEFPYIAPPEYDYSVTFVAAPSGEFLQIQPGGGHQFSWRMGAFEGQWSYFEKLESGLYGRFGGGFSKQWMVGGERYTCVIKVRNDGVEAFLNDKKITSHKTDYTGVSLLNDLKLSRTDTLGLKIAPGFEVEAASVVEITGQGKVLQGR